MAPSRYYNPGRESGPVNLDRYVKVFKGQQVAIALSSRMASDDHVVYTVLSEDDGSWFVNIYSGSSYWLKELVEVTAQAIAWCEANCTPDVEVPGQAGWGWRFKL